MRILFVVSTVKSCATVTDFKKPPVPATVRFEDAPVRFNEPVMVSPDLRTLSDAAPVNVAVIVPAAKLPFASRRTALLAILVVWNVILPAFQILLPLISTASAFAAVISKVPDPSVASPPLASSFTLKFGAARTEDLKLIAGVEENPSFLPRLRTALAPTLSSLATSITLSSSMVKSWKATLIVAVPILNAPVNVPDVNLPSRIV